MTEQEIQEIQNWVGWKDKHGKPMAKNKIVQERKKFVYQILGITWASWGKSDKILDAQRKLVKKRRIELNNF